MFGTSAFKFSLKRIRNRCCSSIRISSISAKTKQNKLEWFEVYKEVPITHPRLKTFGSKQITFGEKLAKSFPNLGVAKIPRGYVFCPQGWLFVDRKYLLPEFSWFGKDALNMNLPSKLPEPVKVRGTVLNLLSDWANINFGHFLLDSIGRLHLFEKAGFNINDCDKVLCPGKPNRKKVELLRTAGVPDEKMLWSAHYTAIETDFLYAPSFPGHRRNYPAWLASYVKNLFIKTPCNSQSRRLYISRAKATRKVKNEEELIPVLKKYGFEIYFPEDHFNDEKDFNQANFIIGPHGAGLTGIVFCERGTNVLELFPEDHVYPYFVTLANAAGLNYFCIKGYSSGVKTKCFGTSLNDFTVDKNAFENAIQTILQIKL
jgi:hypothetical protein